MIREKKTKKDASVNGAFWVVIIISMGIIMLSSLVGYIQNRFGIMHLENIIYFILIILAYFLIKNYLTEYRYSFFDDELIIEKILGKKAISIATIKIREIEFFGKLSEINLSEKEVKIDYCDIHKRRAYVVQYIRKGEKKAITLSPSDDLILHIKKAIEARDFDELNEEKLLK